MMSKFGLSLSLALNLILSTIALSIIIKLIPCYLIYSICHNYYIVTGNSNRTNVPVDNCSLT